MIEFTTGDLLQAETEAIVNTVNCEGYMGKGIAYQFKLEFPENYKAYEQACRLKELKPGRVHTFQENGKIIINFPTKDKWRENSKYEYIETGLESLRKEISERNIRSISIPPLGCGNGGLEWSKVKKIIIENLKDLDLHIKIYEPSQNYRSRPKKEPKLSLSHFLAMEIKTNLEHFSSFRLQKAAFMVDYIENTNYFKFDAHHYGPYSHSLELVAKQISEFQSHHKINTAEAQKILETKLQSDSFYRTINSKKINIDAASKFINSIKENRRLELITSVLYIVHTQSSLTAQEVPQKIFDWSDRKKELFDLQEINAAVNYLEQHKIVEIDVFGKITKKQLPSAF